MLSDKIQSVVLASINPVKVAVVDSVCRSIFREFDTEIVPIDLEDSGPEPVGAKAVISQLTTAIRKAREAYPGARYYISMEGGVSELDSIMYETAFVIVEDATGEIRGISQAAAFPIPQRVAALVAQGISFGAAVEQIFIKENVQNNSGFVGLLTDNLITKHALYVQPAMIAFSKVLKNSWYAE